MDEESKRSNDEQQSEEDLAPLFPKRGEITAAILEARELEDVPETMLVECRVVEFTVESKVNDGNYGTARGYWRVEPDLTVRVPIRPRIDDETGDMEILAATYRTLARTLDHETYGMVSRRVDLRTTMRDEKDARKGGVNATKIVGKSKADATIL